MCLCCCYRCAPSGPPLPGLRVPAAGTHQSRSCTPRAQQLLPDGVSCRCRPLREQSWSRARGRVESCSLMRAFKMPGPSQLYMVNGREFLGNAGSLNAGTGGVSQVCVSSSAVFCTAVPPSCGAALVAQRRISALSRTSTRLLTRHRAAPSTRPPRTALCSRSLHPPDSLSAVPQELRWRSDAGCGSTRPRCDADRH